MFDIEQNISNLPDEDVISIAHDMHKYQMSDMNDSKITVEIQRKFQSAKMRLKSDLNSAKAELIGERKQKDIYKKSSEQAENALRIKVKKEILTENRLWYRRQRLLYFLYLPLITVILTFLIVFQIKNNLFESWLSHLIAILINIVAWFIIDFFVMLPKLTKKFKSRLSDVDKEVEKIMIAEINHKTY